MQELPLECQEHIWSFLDTSDLLPLRATCHTMRENLNMYLSRDWMSNIKIDPLKSALAMCWPLSRQLGPVIGATNCGNSVWFQCTDLINCGILIHCTYQLEWHVMHVSSLVQANFINTSTAEK